MSRRYDGSLRSCGDKVASFGDGIRNAHIRQTSFRTRDASTCAVGPAGLRFLISDGACLRKWILKDETSRRVMRVPGRDLTPTTILTIARPRPEPLPPPSLPLCHMGHRARNLAAGCNGYPLRCITCISRTKQRVSIRARARDAMIMSHRRLLFFRLFSPRSLPPRVHPFRACKVNLGKPRGNGVYELRK